jgi:phosphoenolpyruvate-protein phosphotransferase
MIIAFCTAKGSATSHTAILAKSMGIPAVAGLGESILATPDKTDIMVNGHTGVITLNPDSKTRESFRREFSLQNERMRLETLQATESATTTDGHTIEIAANVGNLSDANAAVANGAKGIGLFRTEFLFLEGNTPPDEETQYRVYREFFAAVKDLPVIVRTLDAGGDKKIPYLDTGREDNPFLGWRSIRICLDDSEMFRTQLRAVLRAGAEHDLRIMFPMITHLEELRQAKANVAKAQKELASRNIPFKENTRVGIMIETPAAVVMADQLAREASFFSIGTNDLTQYTMAADRTNERVASLNDACHPAIFRQIKTVIDQGRANGIPTSICGELAGDLEAIPVLLGLGTDELSMAPFSIPGTISLIRSISLEKSKTLARKALQMETADDVRAYVKSYIRDIAH